MTPQGTCARSRKDCYPPFWKLFTFGRGVLLEGGSGSVGVSAGSFCPEYVIDSWSGFETHARWAWSA